MHPSVKRSDMLSSCDADGDSVTGVSGFCGQDDSRDTLVGDADLRTVRPGSATAVEWSSGIASGRSGLRTGL